jgi:osmoprotectant transport system substrate-binding protein
MKRLYRLLCLPLLALLTAGILIACASNSESPQAAIKVGSKDFTEQFIIGEMYALTLEQAGFTVERKLNLGGTPVAQSALENDEIPNTPEQAC